MKAKLRIIVHLVQLTIHYSQGESSECCGGLLVSLPREQAATYCKDLERLEGYPSWIIGVVETGPRTARIIEKPRILEVPSRDRDDDLW